MRISVLAVAMSLVFGFTTVIEQASAQRNQGRQTTVHRASAPPVTTVSRTIARPVRASRIGGPPRGAYLVRGRYWNPALRWKTDRYTRSVYSVYRGEVWFLDPSTGWAYTIDRYGRVYTCDPRYRAVYSLGPVSAWRGDIPYFFGYFAPDDGYYALPRYRSFVSYYSSPSYRFYDYRSAYDYWWDSYDDYFYSRSFRPRVTFSFWDVRYVRYDRYYVRDVYVDRRGRNYLEPAPIRQPGFINGIPTSGRGPQPGRGFARADDAYLPVAPVRGFDTPPPIQANQIIDRMPPAPEFQAVPAIPINAAEAVAENEAISTPIPTVQEMVSIEQSAPVPENIPVSTFDTVPTIDTSIAPEPVPVTPVSTTEIPPLPVDTGAADPAVPRIDEPGIKPIESATGEFDGDRGLGERESPVFSEPEPVQPQERPLDADVITDAERESEPEPVPEPIEPAASDREFEPGFSESEPAIESEQDESARELDPIESDPEPAYSEPEAVETEVKPAYSEPEPEYSEPEAVETEVEPSYSEPEPSYSEPEPSYSEPEPSYSEPEPSYSEPEPSYSEPEPSYSEPEPSYSEPEPSYSEPEPSYSEPEPSYSEPEPSYSEPEPSYSEPEPSYSEPEPSYSEPEPSYSEPEPSYSEPEPSYSEPEPSYSEPEPSYSEPEPSYSEPEPSYSEPAPENYSSDEENQPPKR